MSKHEAVMMHTFITEEGIKIAAKQTDGQLQSLTIQFPGSGNRPIPIIPSELTELATVASEAAKFLAEPSPRLG